MGEHSPEIKEKVRLEVLPIRLPPGALKVVEEMARKDGKKKTVVGRELLLKILRAEGLIP